MTMAHCRGLTWPAARSFSTPYAGPGIMEAQIQKEKSTSYKHQAASSKQKSS